MYNKIVYLPFKAIFIDLINIMISYWINFMTPRPFTQYNIEIIVLKQSIIKNRYRFQGDYLVFNLQVLISLVYKGHISIP